jgi:acyl-CoA thioesterase-2
VIRILTVEPAGDGVYVGPAPVGGQGRAFGGRLIGQALAAATRTVGPDRVAHSLHAYFLRPGDESQPIRYRTEVERDGRSFAMLRVKGEQGGKAVLEMSASFHTPEPGLHHQFDPPEVPPPEALLGEADYWRDRTDELPPGAYARMARPRSMEFRPVTHRPLAPQEPRPPYLQVWMRAAAPVPDDPALNRAMLAYASDMLLLGATHLPHAISWLTHPMTMASLDHALWLHADARMDDWILYSIESPWTGGGRGLARGLFHDRQGRLIASAAQEGLIRLHPERP